VRLPKVPTALSSGSFVTWCYWNAGAPDPNGKDYSQGGYTGYMLAHARHISEREARPGDLVVFGSGPGKHVALVVEPGRDPLLASHGSSAGPLLVRFSVERSYVPGPVTWLDALD
jgi:cell wall-associated NlpC family hydrolase